MPVTNTSSLAGPFFPNGSTTIFPFAFNAQLPSDVSVFDGNGSLVSPALYTVALYEGDGGTVTFGTAPTAAAFPELFVALVPSFAQTADFTNTGPTYNPLQLTAALDSLATRIIALKGEADRAVKAPIGEVPSALPKASDRAGKFLAFDVDGNPTSADGTGADGSLRADLAGTAGATLVGFRQAGGDLTRTMRDKAREIVSPEDFSGSDTVRLQLALDTGKSVRCSNATYAVNGALTLRATGQAFDLNGATITPTGSFDLFGGDAGIQGNAIGNGQIEGANMTGTANVLSLDTVDRFTMRHLRVFNPLNFAEITECNVAQMIEVWVNNIRGDHGVRWVGDAAARSDILQTLMLIMSFDGNGVGFDWDGNCHTLETLATRVIRPNIGVRVRNTAGATGPAFGQFQGLDIDFPTSFGVDLQAGEDFFFGERFYCHDSATASGVRVGSAIPPDRVTFTGGKITDHATYGIENNVRVRASNLSIFDNGTADYLDPDKVYVSSPRFEIDDTFLFKSDGVNPVLQFDSNDFIGYNRSANDLFASIGGSNRFQVSAANDAVRIMVNNALKQITEGAADSGGTGFKLLRVPN
jgi:hypothetical protein